MAKVCVVTGWVPLRTKHVHTEKYHKMAGDMLEAAETAGASTYVGGGELDDMWAYQNIPDAATLRPAHERSADRYETDAQFTASNIVQHNRTTWAIQAARENNEADVFVWIDYGVLKQGDFTNRRVHQQHIYEFVERLQEVEHWDEIPFPGCWDNKGYWQVDDNSIPWRFVGSVHIWPRCYLYAIDKIYKGELTRFVERTRTMPLDLPIWAMTEHRSSWLPWRYYRANHDYTQFTNYYPVEPMTPLCQLARFYGCDKGGRHFWAGDSCHEYTVAYHQLLSEKRESIKRVLEIGVNWGPSLRMWADYFPNAEIIGLDNTPRTLFQEGRIRTYLADQSSPVSLYRAIEEAGGGKFDLVIDDGSHVPQHQALSADVLMPFVRPDGHYVIEDIDQDSTPWNHVQILPKGYRYRALVCPNGLGKAHDPNDFGPERLIVITHG